jgi:hypothetical protein
MKKRGAGLGREKSKPGGRQLFFFGQEGATGWFERDEFLGLGFFVFPLDVQNCPPLCMCWKLIFIGKNVVRSPNLVPQLLFFCKFDFSNFNWIFLININSNEENH